MQSRRRRWLDRKRMACTNRSRPAPVHAAPLGRSAGIPSGGVLRSDSDIDHHRRRVMFFYIVVIILRNSKLNAADRKSDARKRLFQLSYT